MQELAGGIITRARTGEGCCTRLWLLNSCCSMVAIYSICLKIIYDVSNQLRMAIYHHHMCHEPIKDRGSDAPDSLVIDELVPLQFHCAHLQQNLVF